MLTGLWKGCENRAGTSMGARRWLPTDASAARWGGVGLRGSLRAAVAPARSKAQGAEGAEREGGGRSAGERRAHQRDAAKRPREMHKVWGGCCPAPARGTRGEATGVTAVPRIAPLDWAPRAILRPCWRLWGFLRVVDSPVAGHGSQVVGASADDVPALSEQPRFALDLLLAGHSTVVRSWPPGAPWPPPCDPTLSPAQLAAQVLGECALGVDGEQGSQVLKQQVQRCSVRHGGYRTTLFCT